MRKPIIAGNWKMYKTVGEAVSLVKDLSFRLKDVDDVDIVVCPPFTALRDVSEILGKSQNITLGAQDVHWEKEGAFTGEISPLMLKDLGVKYVIIGHSERRGIFKETDEMVNKKVKTALASGLAPIVCVGESLEAHKTGKTKEVVQNQLFKGLADLKDEDAGRIVLAYEPIWAIGTGLPATAEDANEVSRYLRALIGSKFSQEVARETRIQYGGSVKPENIAEFMAEPDIDGALVGGASLEAESFAQIIKQSFK